MIKNRYAQTWWTLDDIKDRRPKWSRKECAKWLDRNEEKMMRIATDAVNQMIDAILTEEN